jgi:glycerol-3-phosphate O-acyltransferase / dihydroxyacetone phosphate acyltransferase
MVYRLLKLLCKFTLRFYFRRVRIVGKEKIPNDVPCIFIANHPSAFMDPIVVATTVRQPVYFIAAGEYVGKGIKGWFFRNFLHMIPVFRPSTRPEDVHKNKDMFNYCFDHLSGRNSLLIFPEGVSITERKLKPLKTGVARIARGAELKNNRELHLVIIPIGLNYSDPHRFRSDLFVNIGEPIRVNEYITANPENEIEEVERLTDLCEEKLRESVIHIDTENTDKVLDLLNTIYSRDLKLELGIDFKEQEREFKMQKEMLDATLYFREHQPETFLRVTAQMSAYADKLNKNGLNDKDIKEIKFQKSFRRIGSYIIGFPVFLLGFLPNFIPYFLVDFTVKRLKMNETFKGSMILAAGLFIYGGFYTALALLAGIFTPIGWFALLLPFVFYGAGIYALLYITAINHSRKRKNLRRVLRGNKELTEELIVERKKLITELEECRLEYELLRVEG